jgi:hypothetical protein
MYLIRLQRVPPNGKVEDIAEVLSCFTKIEFAWLFRLPTIPLHKRVLANINQSLRVEKGGYIHTIAEIIGITLGLWIPSSRTAREPVGNTMFDMRDDFTRQRLYSVPITNTGIHWRAISSGAKVANYNKDMYEYHLKRFLPLCTQLDELSMPMDKSACELFNPSSC